MFLIKVSWHNEGGVVAGAEADPLVLSLLLQFNVYFLLLAKQPFKTKQEKLEALEASRKPTFIRAALLRG